MNRAYFSKRQFLEIARLGYFLWITGSLKATIISNLVEKKTKFLDDPCTSPSWGKKSTACEYFLIKFVLKYPTGRKGTSINRKRT